MASADQINFVEWAKKITENMKYITANGTTLLLLYDGYRNHMCVQTLELFKKNIIVAVALPAHTSGVTQPLDLSVCGPWKTYYRELLAEALCGRKLLVAPLDEFHVSKLFSKAYSKSIYSTEHSSWFCQGWRLSIELWKTN